MRLTSDHCLLTTLAIALCVSACTTPEHEIMSATATPPSLQELKQTRYRGILPDPVRLTDGDYEGAPHVDGGAARPTVQMIEDLYLIGDLDGDGREEAAVVLVEQSSGSGTRLYLAIAGRDADGAASNLATVLIGDRVQIISASMDNGGVDMRLVRTGPEDACCCPGEIVSARWTMTDGSLRLVSDKVEGRLNAAELSGSSWRLQGMERDGAKVEDTGITLNFEDHRVSGHSGCNNYFGDIQDGAGPGEIHIGPLAGTRMACEPSIMELENAYLRSLQTSTRFSFLAGTLMLSSVDADGQITQLRFVRQHTDSPGP